MQPRLSSSSDPCTCYTQQSASMAKITCSFTRSAHLYLHADLFARNSNLAIAHYEK
uniref:Uncharacterized protein n=1 Tax=Arundo donax TaxID=35708 RepID=A0A0A9FJV4_ARUDO